MQMLREQGPQMMCRWMVRKRGVKKVRRRKGMARRRSLVRWMQWIRWRATVLPPERYQYLYTYMDNMDKVDG
jgi:hypothetical protein